MAVNEIKNFIFDFGDVLVTDTAKIFQQRFGRHWNKKEVNIFKKICEQDDLGQYTLKQFCQVLRQKLAPKTTIGEVETIISGFKLLKNTWNLANQLALRYPVIILSNNSKDGPNLIAKKLGIAYKKIPFVNSSKVGLRKPDLAIYKFVFKNFGFRPEQTLLIDDKKINLIPARRLGCLTFEYKKNYKKLLSFLKHHGVKF